MSLISVDLIFDPESIDWESREYNYLVTVEVAGHTRQKYFMDIHDATEWGYDTVLALEFKVYGEEKK
jgi:hypothetical protein